MNIIGIIVLVGVFGAVAVGGMMMAVDMFGHPRTW